MSQSNNTLPKAGNHSTNAPGKVPGKPVLYLRGLAWWLVFFFSIVVFTIPVLLAQKVSYETGYRMIRRWLTFHMTALKWICGLEWRVTGLENLPDHPCIVMSKHQSTFETFVMPMIFESPVFVAKRELALIPGFGWCLALSDAVLIRRGAGRSAIRQLVEQSAERFARNRSLVIFPEGTRRAPDDPPVYKIGGAVVASETGVRVVPISHNAGEFWPRHSFIKWPGTIDLKIGKPIDSEGRSAAEILEEVVDSIEAEQVTMRVPNRFPY